MQGGQGQGNDEFQVILMSPRPSKSVASRLEGTHMDRLEMQSVREQRVKFRAHFRFNRSISSSKVNCKLHLQAEFLCRHCIGFEMGRIVQSNEQLK